MAISFHYNENFDEWRIRENGYKIAVCDSQSDAIRITNALMLRDAALNLLEDMKIHSGQMVQADDVARWLGEILNAEVKVAS